MRIESGLYASREGLVSNGVAIAVTGDDISNANTVGYKSSRVEFADLMAEGAEGRRSTSGEPVGNGVQVSRIRQIHENGVIEFSGRDLDAAVAGNGFFAVGDSSLPNYTRAGNFEIDENGFLVNSDGLQVLGYTGTETTTLGPIDMLNLNLTGTPTSTASVFGNLDVSEDNAVQVPNNPATFRDISDNANFISTLRVFDSLGVGHDLTIAYYKTGVNTWTAQAYIAGEEVGGAEGTPVQVGADATLNFGTDGIIADANTAAATIAATPAYSNGAAAGNFTIDLSTYTQFGGSTQVSAVTQDGEGTGNIDKYEIRRDGTIYANLDSGTSAQIGTLALADFANVDGLDRAGNTLFQETTRSGVATIGLAGTARFGDIEGGSLERSNVDIANEFVELVVFQRGYQGSSQTLNAVNEILQQTLGLIR